jgi:hypothetical protein
MRRFFNNIINYFISGWVNFVWNLRLSRGKRRRFFLRCREFLGRKYLRLWYWVWDRFR